MNVSLTYQRTREAQQVILQNQVTKHAKAEPAGAKKPASKKL